MKRVYADHHQAARRSLKGSVLQIEVLEKAAAVAAADAAKKGVSAEELDAAEARARSAAAAAARKEAATQELHYRVDQLTWCQPSL